MKKIDANILVIDDDLDILVSARLLLKQYFSKISVCDSPKDLNELLATSDTDIILLDMNFRKGTNDGREGLYWLKHILAIDPRYIVIMMTAFGQVEMAVECLKSGASDFILKPWNIEKLVSTLSASRKLKQTNSRPDSGAENPDQSKNASERNANLITGTSSEMLDLMSTIRKVAPTDANILILGENGTGKQVIAQEIYRQSDRSGRGLLHVDLGSFNSQLFESELFGYAKGAFTDAREERAGRFEMAHGGTLFLDEIGNLPMALQSKLLHVLQNRTVVRLGENKERLIDIRLICATNMDLKNMVSEGSFRQDLLYRINTVELQLPPLRRRKADILILAEHFLEVYNHKYRKHLRMESEAKVLLQHYPWPGNVRELQHVMERAVIMAEHEMIEENDLNLPDEKADLEPLPENLELVQMEERMIRKALEKNQGNISKAALDLGLTRAALYRRMEKFNL